MQLVQTVSLLVVLLSLGSLTNGECDFFVKSSMDVLHPILTLTFNVSDDCTRGLVFMQVMSSRKDVTTGKNRFSDFCLFQHNNATCIASTPTNSCTCPSENTHHQYVAMKNVTVEDLDAQWRLTGLSQSSTKIFEIPFNVTLQNPPQVERLEASAYGGAEVSTAVLSVQGHTKVKLQCWWKPGFPPKTAKLIKDRFLLETTYSNGNKLEYVIDDIQCGQGGNFSCEVESAPRNHSVLIDVQCEDTSGHSQSSSDTTQGADLAKPENTTIIPGTSNGDVGGSTNPLDHTVVLYISVCIVFFFLIITIIVFGILFKRKVLSAGANSNMNQQPVSPVRDHDCSFTNSALSIDDIYQEIEEDRIPSTARCMCCLRCRKPKQSASRFATTGAFATRTHRCPTVGCPSSESDSEPDMHPVAAHGGRTFDLSWPPNTRHETRRNEAVFERKEIVFENELSDNTRRVLENEFSDGKGIVFENECAGGISALTRGAPVGLRIVHHCKPPSDVPVGTSVDSTDSEDHRSAASKKEGHGAKKNETDKDDYLHPVASKIGGQEAKKNETDKDDDYLHPVSSKKDKQEQKHESEAQGDLEGAVGGACGFHPDHDHSSQRQFASGARPKVGAGRSRFHTSTVGGKRVGRRNTDHDIRSPSSQPQQMFSHLCSSLGHSAGSLVHFTKFPTDEHTAVDDLSIQSLALATRDNRGLRIIPRTERTLPSLSDSSSDSDGYLRPGISIFKDRKKSRSDRNKFAQSSQPKNKMESKENTFQFGVPKPPMNMSLIRPPGDLVESTLPVPGRGNPFGRPIPPRKPNKMPRLEQERETASGCMHMNRQEETVSKNTEKKQHGNPTAAASDTFQSGVATPPMNLSLIRPQGHFGVSSLPVPDRGKQFGRPIPPGKPGRPIPPRKPNKMPRLPEKETDSGCMNRHEETVSKNTETKHHGNPTAAASDYMCMNKSQDDAGPEETADGYMCMNRRPVTVDIHLPFDADFSSGKAEYVQKESKTFGTEKCDPAYQNLDIV